MKPGEIIASKYRLTSRIGQGGMGSVWRVTNTATGREFAIKLLHAAVASSEDSRRRFIQEAKASARINHPNAIDIFDVGETEDGSLYLVMELLEGISLADALRSEPAFNARDLLIVMSEACTALHAAHAAGIVHRDLKPPNLFLHRDRATGFAIAKVLDFGVSKLINDDGVTTNTGALLGSPRYMSPEQSISASSADARSDIWSIGVLLFEALTGRFPHDGDSSSNLIIAIATKPPKHIDAVAPHLPLSLRMLVTDCLKPVEARVPSVGLLLDRMLSILATEDLTAVPLAKPTVGMRKMQPRPEGLLVRSAPATIPGLQTSMLAAHGLQGLARYMREGSAALFSQSTPESGFAPPSTPIARAGSYPMIPSGVAYGQQLPAPQATGVNGTLVNGVPVIDPAASYPLHPYGAARPESDPTAERISSISVVGARPAASMAPASTGSEQRRGAWVGLLIALVGACAFGGTALFAYTAFTRRGGPVPAEPAETSAPPRASSSPPRAVSTEPSIEPAQLPSSGTSADVVASAPPAASSNPSATQPAPATTPPHYTPATPPPQGNSRSQIKNLQPF